MMEHLNQQLFTGERALFKGKDLQISHSVFADGESPLKESNNIVLENTIFRWKYPLWVCVNLFYAKFRNLTCTAYLEMF